MRDVTRRSRLALAFAVCLALAACAPAPSRNVVVAWHTLSGARERALLALIDRFNESNPDGIVVLPERRSPDDQHRAILDGGARGALPGLALVSPAQAAVYEQRGLLTALDALTNEGDPAMGWNASARADLYPFVQQAGRTPAGRLVGVPLGGSARMMLANRDWAATLQQPSMPGDWEAFAKICAPATDRVAGTVCYGVNPNDVLFEEWVEAHGTPVIAPDGALQIASPGAAAAIDALLADLQAGLAYRMTVPARSIDDFAAARVMFAMDWSDRLAAYLGAVRESGNFGLDAGALPAPVGGVPIAQLQAPLWVLPRGERPVTRDAWKFANWLLAEEQTAFWARETGDLPARASAVNALQLDTSAPAGALRAAILQRVAPHAKAVPLYSGWPCVQAELAAGLRQIFEGQPVTETLLTMQARAQEVLNTDCSAPAR